MSKPMSPPVAHFVSSLQRGDASAFRGEPDGRWTRPPPPHLTHAGRCYQFPSPTFLAPQKSGLSARGTSAAFPEYHWMFSAQASSAQSAAPLPPLP